MEYKMETKVKIDKSPKRRRSSTSLSAKLALENLTLLNSVQVNYPLYSLSEHHKRIIPDSQRHLIKSFIDHPLESQNLILRKKYSTNVDDRNYLSVYEYQINDNWIIWDYYTGYVFFTGLWKACGNTKTDIVKLVENFPSLQTSVRRVRGGFLKIQGTWLPYHTVRELAKNFCFNVRFCLVPMFGETFPDECLKPDNENFGKLVDVNAPPLTKPRRRSTHTMINKPIMKRRSKSDSLHGPLLEMEEILKASKQLHDLSSSSTEPSFMKGHKRSNSFQYGGFVWKWQNNNNLCVLGREEEAIVDEDPEDTPISSAPQLSSSPYVKYEHVNEQYLAKSLMEMTPKSYDGYETVVSAAHQLIKFSTSSSEKKKEQRGKNKMDIGGLLS